MQVNPFIYTRPNLGSLFARQFDTRLREHQLADSNLDKRKSALADQVCQTKHSFAWGDWRYNTTSIRCGQRRGLERVQNTFFIRCISVTNPYMGIKLPALIVV